MAKESGKAKQRALQVNQDKAEKEEKCKVEIPDLINAIGTKIKDGATIADLIRLIQLLRELKDEEQPKEVKITWVEPQPQS